MIEINDIVTLDDNNDFVVVSKANYENKTYYYLVEINNNANLMFCYKDNDELIELTNKELITKLLPLFLESSKEILNEILNEDKNQES